jgi:hypothetical protein
MSGETHTFELTPELIDDIMSLMKGIQNDNCLLQKATKKKKFCLLQKATKKKNCHDEEKNQTMEIFHEVFKKIGLSDAIRSAVLVDTLRQALELKSLIQELRTTLE